GRSRSHRRAYFVDARRSADGAILAAMNIRCITLLGSTGSIGRSALDVVARHPERFRILALAAHSQWERLLEQCRQFRPRFAALLDASAADCLRDALARDGLAIDVLSGESGLAEIAALPEADTVLAAIVGAAGLRPTLAAASS